MFGAVLELCGVLLATFNLPMMRRSAIAVRYHEIGDSLCGVVRQTSGEIDAPDREESSGRVLVEARFQWHDRRRVRDSQSCDRQDPEAGPEIARRRGVKDTLARSLC